MNNKFTDSEIVRHLDVMQEVLKFLKRNLYNWSKIKDNFEKNIRKEINRPSLIEGLVVLRRQIDYVIGKLEKENE